nr:MAG TPA: hypothetical protein [Caudoviricetes sp.]
MKRGKHNKAVLAQRIIDDTRFFAEESPEYEDVRNFWNSRAERVLRFKLSKTRKDYLYTLISAVELQPL